MTFETFLWSRLKRRVLCRSLHIHIPSQRRTCPAAKGKHWEASQRGIHPKNKKLQPLPLLECQEVCLFCCVLFFNRSFNRWATVTRLVRKVHPTRRSNFSSLRYRQRAISPKQGPALGAIHSCNSYSNGAMVKLKHVQFRWVQLSPYWA